MMKQYVECEVMTVQIFWDDLTDKAKDQLRDAFASRDLNVPEQLWSRVPIAIFDVDIQDRTQYGVYFERSIYNETRTGTD